MLERNLNYQYTRSVHEFYAVSADVLAIRVISAAGNILEIGKGAFSISDLEDSSFIELFVGDRIIRMDYSGTLSAVRTADIALIRPYLPCGGSGGGGGGGSVVVTNIPLPVTGANDKVNGTPTVINHNAGLTWVSVLPANPNRNYLAIKNNGNQRIRVRYNGGNPETFLPQERMSIESNYIITSEIEIQSVVGVQPVDIIHG